MQTDEALLELAVSLNTKLGRPPRADELIEAAGGCQRKRALSAIQSLRLDLSQRAVRSQLLFPPSIESQLRQLMGAWLDLAAQHLGQRHAEFSEEVERRQDALVAQLEELQATVEAQRRELEQMHREQQALTRQVDERATERDRIRTDRDAARAVADERQQLIEKLLARLDASPETGSAHAVQ